MPFDDLTGLYQTPHQREIAIIAKARDIIQARGILHQALGVHGYQRCLLGAILEADGVDTTDHPAYPTLPPLIERAAAPALRKRGYGSIPDFNDRYRPTKRTFPGATKEEALVFLDEVRAELEKVKVTA